MLEKIDRCPPGFFSDFDYLWVLKGNRVYKRKRARKDTIHAKVWGDWVWSVDERGYYSSKDGVLSCHGAVSKDLERKLAKKFPEAIRIRPGWE